MILEISLSEISSLLVTRAVLKVSVVILTKLFWLTVCKQQNMNCSFIALCISRYDGEKLSLNIIMDRKELTSVVFDQILLVS